MTPVPQEGLQARQPERGRAKSGQSDPGNAREQGQPSSARTQQSGGDPEKGKKEHP